LDLGSVNAPPPLEHRQSGVGWSSGGGFRQPLKCCDSITATSFKQQAASDKQQAASNKQLDK